MNEIEDRLSFQPDIYQRYGLLTRLTDVILEGRSDSDSITLLDVGSGPTALTAAFVSSRFSIVRADVSSFGDPAIVEIRGAEPLPFADGAFDVAVALEVLEHVAPGERPLFVRELQRVAREAVILCCPVDTPETVAAEHAFSTWASRVAQQDIAFLVEHRELGLPHAAQVRAWFRDPDAVLVADNAPLDDWLALNLLDFVHACDLGEGEAKAQFSTLVNAARPFARQDAPHYRRFFCAFRSPAHADAARLAVAAATAPRAGDALPLVHDVVAGLLNLRDEQRQRASRAVEALQHHVGDLDRTLEEFKAALAHRDTHIANLDALVASTTADLAAANASLGERETQLASLTARADAGEATLAGLRVEHESLQAEAVALTARIARDETAATAIGQTLRALLTGPRSSTVGSGGFEPLIDVRRVAEALGDEVRLARQQLAEATSRALAFQRLVEQLLASRTWRWTKPLRAAASLARRIAPLERPRRAWSRLRDWLVERSRRRERYAAVVASGLFDPEWYRDRHRDVRDRGIDPLVHYLKRGAAEGRDPHPLFDAAYYLAQTGPLPPGMNPLLHYVLTGARERRQPHPLFDTGYYLERYPDMGTAAINPLAHYYRDGGRERRDPHPLFASGYYLDTNPDVVAAGINPLVHFLVAGAHEGRNPHPLFDTLSYTRAYPDVVAAGWNPLLHYLTHGAAEGRNPHPFFDSSFYLQQNPDVAASGLNPLVHYVQSGALEGRDPHRHFDAASYLSTHPDLRAHGLNPLVHYLQGRRHEGLTTATGPATAAYVPPAGRLPWFDPLNLAVSPRLATTPRLNVLVPGLAMRHLSGGPNTALEIAGRLALHGVRVRLIATDAPLDEDAAPFWSHLGRLLGGEVPPTLELVSGHDRAKPLPIGERDVFMATAWWTAQQAKYAVRLTRHARFVYLIQDYEALLHPASTQQALALETYGLDHLPVINSRWLHEFLSDQRIGRFADRGFAERSLVFEPAVDRRLFFPASSPVRARRRLLFYARPTNGLRNLFELGVAALEKALAEGIFEADGWEFVGMGEAFAAVPLGRGALLTPAPWLGLDDYARQMRESDLLLSLMLSPHPSYPPLEMAACGGVTVTTAFANKSAAALAALSPNIIGVEPTVEAISAGLDAAVMRLADVEGRAAAAAMPLPASWADSLSVVVPRLADELIRLQAGDGAAADGGRILPGFEHWPRDEYEVHRLDALVRRRSQYPRRPEPGLLSLLTPVWNTPPDYLDALADSILNQDDDASFEWIVLDNGSVDPRTKAALERLSRARVVRLIRSDRNLGIIAGTRRCLEHATGRYTATVDHDDLLTPDCIRVLAHALRAAGYPAIAYTDEDKLAVDHFGLPYLKPGFDPVLFANSCYVAHLGVVDRERALELEAYTDGEAEGSHDWDTFTRFVLAGHTPVHIPEVLYSWRVHEASTAGNIHSKPFVYDSQRRVLTKLVAGLAPSGRIRLEPSPLFDGLPDWWMRRDAVDAQSISTIVLAGAADPTPDVPVAAGVPHDPVRLDPKAGTAGLLALLEGRRQASRLVHILWHDTAIVDKEWALEALGLFELFPDTAIVGARLHQRGRVLHAGAYFGFGRGCDAPDRGRSLSDPGYAAQAWKPHSVSAVAFDHCVLDAAFAVEALARHVPPGASLAYAGAWLGAAARRLGRRVVYSPFLSAMPSVDRDAAITSVEQTAFADANRDLMPDAELWPPHAGLRLGQPLAPASPAIARVLPGEPDVALSYEDELAADRLGRALPETPAAAAVAFSLITGVYARSPAGYFDAAIKSVLAQTHVGFEWIIVRDGPVTDAVQALLDGLGADRRVRVLTHDACLGIQRGLRACLEAAVGEWVVPIDADDLLEIDALAVIARAIAGGDAEYLFSDEDHLVGDRLQARFARPGVDPVLNLESSYIWHLSAFRRDRALALGAYTDVTAEFCHDLDTSTRFARAGVAMAHVPHVLYHWRSHEASSTHQATQNPGTRASTRAVLERVVSEQATPSRYEIAEYPIDRGAVEWWIRRRPGAAPSLSVILFGDSAPSLATAAWADFPHGHDLVSLALEVRGLDDWRVLGETLTREAELVLLLDARWQLSDDAWLWEAVKWFELQPDTAIVGGRLIDQHDIVVDAGFALRAGSAVPVYRGLRRADPGPFALALKAQSLYAPAAGCFVARRTALAAAIRGVVNDGCTAPFALTLGERLRAASQRVVYSPLIEARRLRPGRRRAPGATTDRAELSTPSNLLART